MATPLRLIFRKMMRSFWLFAGLCLLAQDAPRDTMLVLGPEEVNYQQAIQGIIDGAEQDFIVTHQIIDDQKTTYAGFSHYLDQHQPKLIVLLDNHAIEYFRRYQKEYQGQKPIPPAIASMALFVRQSIRGLSNTVGISNEIPASTSFRKLREVIGKPVDRVGVIYREDTREVFERQKEYCAQEQIELVGYYVEDERLKDVTTSVKRGLRQLIKKDKVDAMWILNDNLLLTEDSLSRAWVDRLSKFRKPVVVGIRPFIENMPFGNFAVLPDYYGIGKQVAEMAIDIRDNDWYVESGDTAEPHSSQTFLRTRFARKYLDLDEEKLQTIDNEIKDDQN